MDWMQILGPTLLIVLGGVIIWFIRSRLEELRKTQEKLNEERRKAYVDILEPVVQTPFYSGVGTNNSNDFNICATASKANKIK